MYLGGKVERADVREYGKTEVIIDKKESKVFEGVSPKTICWMSHFDYISKLHQDLRLLHIQQTVRWQQLKTEAENCMQSSSIQRYFILLKEQR